MAHIAGDNLPVLIFIVSCVPDSQRKASKIGNIKTI